MQQVLLEELAEEAIRPLMYHEDFLRYYMSSIDITSNHNEDNLKSAQFRERATTVNNKLQARLEAC